MYKGHIKDIRITKRHLKYTMTIKDKTLANRNIVWFTEKKLERLAVGIYAVTESVSDSEPLKWRLRSQAVSFITDRKNYWSLKDRSYTDEHGPVFYSQVMTDRLSVDLEKIISLLEVARAGAVVSAVNCTILLQEYQYLYENLKSRATDFASTLKAPEPTGELAEGSSPSTSGVSQRRNVSDRPFSVSADDLTTNGPDRVNSSKQSDPAQAGATTGKSSTARVSGSGSGVGGSVDSKVKRKEEIKRLLAERGWSSVRDLATHIPDCSTKTIQRELVEMVEQGILKKQGEKRWSRYDLA